MGKIFLKCKQNRIFEKWGQRAGSTVGLMEIKIESTSEEEGFNLFYYSSDKTYLIPF